ncbi:ADP-ribosylglycohydrolase family protein [Comamonas flocculans]|uniref:ADP-ribosylglycohydrolase family protein n=1 Tax=Comamonas flocculans TaxID=2597701 RepID=A0A5B8RYB0_9BURK|nr:ADP-ribosylglycohydrolase family protein [Comamonas flocculans]QEA14123.1 ADP-ribosylglycohydrolase family protein [Comamonas flocculans]
MARTQWQERAAGALMGALVGEALAVGPHWYYDLDALRAAFGPWISDYAAPKPGHYHHGLKAGESSQAGLLLELTMRSLADCGRYDEADFCQRLDRDFFPLIDGTPNHGPGGYTSQSMRETWRLRVGLGKPWGQVAGWADTTEAAERVLAIAVRNARDPLALARDASSNTALTQQDASVAAMTTAYALALGQLVQGARFDSQISERLMALVRDGKLPFHSVTRPDGDGVPDGPERPRQAGQFPSPDALIGMGYIAGAALDAGVRIEPAWKVSQVYGMPCAVYHQFPAVYHLAARFADDFESAVLHAVNGGGQNQARAMLTGALVGAMVGVQGIPERFISGLDRHEERLQLARRIAAQSEAA